MVDPNHADTYAMRTDLLVMEGQPLEAIASAAHALRLNPHPPSWYYWLKGEAEYSARQYEIAIATLRNEVDLRHGGAFDSRRGSGATRTHRGRSAWKGGCSWPTIPTSGSRRSWTPSRFASQPTAPISPKAIARRDCRNDCVRRAVARRQCRRHREIADERAQGDVRGQPGSGRCAPISPAATSCSRAANPRQRSRPNSKRDWPPMPASRSACWCARPPSSTDVLANNPFPASRAQPHRRDLPRRARRRADALTGISGREGRDARTGHARNLRPLRRRHGRLASSRSWPPKAVPRAT